MGTSKSAWQSYKPQREDVVRVVKRLPRADDLMWGVSVAPYQVEGGLNESSHGRRNNWAQWEDREKVERSGLSSDFFHRYEQDMDLAKGLGIGGFRLGIEWARIRPGKDGDSSQPGSPPPLDEAALDSYAHMMASVMNRGMTPVVTLHHYTHPEWLGPDPWLDSATVEERFVPYVLETLEGINSRLISRHQVAPLPYIVTVNEPFGLAFGTYGLGTLPSGVKAGVLHGGLAKAAVALENLYLAHVAAYQAIHQLYRQRGWAQPTVTFNGVASSVYEAEFLALDLLKARQEGVPAGRMRTHLAQSRLAFYEQLTAIPLRRGGSSMRAAIEKRVQGRIAAAMGPEPFVRLSEAVLKAKSLRLVDVVSFGYYDPFYGDFFELGFPRLVKTRLSHWDWPPAPEALVPYLRMYSQVAGKLPVHILENGIALRCSSDGQPVPRRDGLRRSSALRIILLEVFRAMGQGVKCRAYFYRSLMDGYEWGSFEPRFGLFGVRFDDPARPRMESDIAGDPAGKTYKEIIDAYSSGEEESLVNALMGDDTSVPHSP